MSCCVDSTWTRGVVTVCSVAVTAWSVSGQLAASSSHPDGGGRCAITSLSSCLYRGSWIYLSVGLSDSPPRRAEVCDREMEGDGGWTGRVRADCLSVMNINGLQVSLSSSGSALWKQAWDQRCGMEVAHPPPPLPLFALTDFLHCTHRTNTNIQIRFFLCCLLCDFRGPSLAKTAGSETQHCETSA